MTLRCCFSASMWHWSNVISSTKLICFQHIQVKTLLWHLFFTVKTPSLYLKPLGVVLDDLKINPAICNITIHSVFMKADSPFHCFSFESSVVRPYLTFLFSNVINYVRLFLFAILHSSLTFIGYITSLLFKVSVWIHLLWKDWQIFLVRIQVCVCGNQWLVVEPIELVSPVIFNWSSHL